VSADADVRALRPNPDHVTVTVRGDKALLEQLTAGRIRVTADMTGSAAIQNLHRHLDVAAPPGVTLVRVTPPDVDVVAPLKP
jgi:hypothetical protein